MRAYPSGISDAKGILLDDDCLEENGEPFVVTEEGKGHCSGVLALAICEGYVCSAGGDAMIQIWHEHTLEYVM